MHGNHVVEGGDASVGDAANALLGVGDARRVAAVSIATQWLAPSEYVGVTRLGFDLNWLLHVRRGAGTCRDFLRENLERRRVGEANSRDDADAYDDGRGTRGRRGGEFESRGRVCCSGGTVRGDEGNVATGRSRRL